MPGVDVLVSTAPFLRVMVDESVSITSRTAVMAPEGRVTVPSSSVMPPCSANRLIRRLGVARVMKPFAEPVSGLREADTLTTYRSTRATRSNGKGSSVSRVRVEWPSPGAAGSLAQAAARTARRARLNRANDMEPPG